MVSKRFVFLLLILSCAFALAVAGTTAPTVSGTLTLDGKDYKIQQIKAETAENPFDENKKDVVLTLTDVPAPADGSDLWDLAEKGKIHGLIIAIDEEKQPHRMTILGVAQQSGNSVCDFEATKFDTKMVEGRLFLKEPNESFGHKYQFDVKFSTPVTDTVVPVVDENTGKPLPAGGGEPGAAYLAYDKAVASGDLAAMKKFAADEKTKKQMSDPKAKEMLEMMKAMRATNIKIVKGFINGDRATLHLEGKDPMGGGKATAVVRMLKVNGQWCIEKESWKGSMD
jgi:hypothetical protein